MEKYINEYRDALELEGKSDKTIRSYTDTVNNLMNFLEDNNSNFKIEDIKLQYITAFLLYIKKNCGRNGKDATPTTLNSRLAGIKSYLKFLYKNDIITKDIAKYLVKYEDNRKKDLKVLTDEEINCLKNAVNHPKIYTKNIEFQKSRDELIIYLFLNQALRDEEARELKLDCMDFNSQLLHVRKAKRNQTRKIFIDDKGIELFKNYLVERANISDIIIDVDYLLLTCTGKKIYDDSSMRFIIKKLLRFSDIPSNRCDEISQHTLRHTMITMSYRKGIRVDYISKHVGHSNTATTERFYIHENEQDIKNRGITLEY
ncbi:MAG: tyrosine-type recombinase/integrase [Clostridium sp.]|uniref:tyrosine-type recombinase/integrase n=1 Tax=Clostridium sp. TaxID=1506 RepID=UPI003F333632